MIQTAVFALATAFAAGTPAFFGGQVGQVDRLTNVNIVADTVESSDQVLLTNLKVSYESSVRGPMTEDLRVAKEALTGTCSQICREFGAGGAVTCPTPPAEDPESTKDEDTHTLAIQSDGKQVQFRWFPEYRTMLITEIVCSIR